VSGGYWSGYDTDHARQVANMTSWWMRRMTWLHEDINKLELFPATKSFGTAVYNSDDIITRHTFALTAFGDIKDLDVSLEKGTASAFEISTEIQSNISENDAYTAFISVQPKGSLSAASYNDVLIVSGENQGKAFTLKSTLSFTVSKATPAYTLPTGVTASVGQRLLNVALPHGWSWMDRTLTVSASQQTYKAMFTPDDTKNYNVVSNIDVSIMLITSSEDVSPANSLNARIHNGILYMSGLTPGEKLSIYNAAGTLIYQFIAVSNEEKIQLKVTGLYIIKTEQSSVKVIYAD
jgi:hypothetical protein